MPEHFDENLDKLASSSQELDNQRMGAKISVKKVNILCLSSDTGGGHRASAESLANQVCDSILSFNYDNTMVDTHHFIPSPSITPQLITSIII